MLAAILARKTGQTLTQFLKPRLFQPLGMGDIHCHTLPDGTQMGGAGMSLTIEDMARFVQFVANRGRWEGKQLLFEGWFDLATSKQIENRGAGWGGGPGLAGGLRLPVLALRPRRGVPGGTGAFGQYGVVFTRQDAALVIHSASMKLQAVLTAAWDNLLPAFWGRPPAGGPPRPAPAAKSAWSGWSSTRCWACAIPGPRPPWTGALYRPAGPCPLLCGPGGGASDTWAPPGPGALKSLSLRLPKGGRPALWEEDGGSYALDLGLQGHFVQTELSGTVFGANSRWRTRDELEVGGAQHPAWPAGGELIFRFDAQGLTLSGSPTLPEEGGLTGPAMPTVAFRLEEGSVNTKTKMYWEQ